MSIFTKSCNNKIDLENKKNKFYVFLILTITIILISVTSLVVGSSSLKAIDIFKYFTFQEISDKTEIIIETLRLPRLAGGLIVGSSLALAGFILQVVLNNSLASPSTIGVNSGAALFVVLGASLFSSIQVNVWAFIGSLIVVFLVVGISYFTNSSRITIILTGISISAICSGLIDLITIFNVNVIYDKTSFYIGGLGTVNINDIKYALPLILIAYVIIFAFRNSFSILVLGDSIAYSLGVNVKRTRIIAIIVVALLSSTATTIAGLIGFVGIIVPHIVRKVLCGDVKVLIVVTAILGGIFVVFADTIGRVLISPYEIPVGIVLSLTGGPFFIYLLLNSSKRGQFL